MKQRAFDHLTRDRMAHIDMLEILLLPKAEVVSADDHGVLLAHGDLFLLASEPGRTAERAGG